MSLLLFFGGTPAAQPGGTVLLSFIDEHANPLPAGVQVTLYAGSGTLGAVALRQYLSQGAALRQTVTSGTTYTAAFSGTQAPSGTVTFIAPTTNAPLIPVPITVPNYDSPDPTQTQYATLQTTLWPRDWFSDSARATGGAAYNLAWAAGWIYAQLDTQEQIVLGGERVLSSVGTQVDTWVYDFFGNSLPRQAAESDLAYANRAIANLSAKKSTPAGMKTITGYYGTDWLSEPWNPAETGAWDTNGVYAWDSVGGWGTQQAGFMAFVSLAAGMSSTQMKGAVIGSKPLGMSYTAVSVSGNTGTIV